MTTTAATGYGRAAAPVAPSSRIHVRALLRVFLDRLERMLLPRGLSHTDELPPEWFKFPPI